MDRVCRELFLITDNSEQMEMVKIKIEEALKGVDGVEYGWDDEF